MNLIVNRQWIFGWAAYEGKGQSVANITLQPGTTFGLLSLDFINNVAIIEWPQTDANGATSPKSGAVTISDLKDHVAPFWLP